MKYPIKNKKRKDDSKLIYHYCHTPIGRTKTIGNHVFYIDIKPKKPENSQEEITYDLDKRYVFYIYGKNGEFKGRSVYFKTEEEMEKFAKNTEENIAKGDVYHKDYKCIQRYKLTK